MWLETCKGDNFLEGTFEKASRDHIDQKWDHIDSEESLGEAAAEMRPYGEQQLQRAARCLDRHVPCLSLQKKHIPLCRPVELSCGDRYSNRVRLNTQCQL